MRVELPKQMRTNVLTHPLQEPIVERQQRQLQMRGEERRPDVGQRHLALDVKKQAAGNLIVELRQKCDQQLSIPHELAHQTVAYHLSPDTYQLVARQPRVRRRRQMQAAAIEQPLRPIETLAIDEHAGIADRAKFFYSHPSPPMLWSKGVYKGKTSDRAHV